MSAVRIALVLVLLGASVAFATPMHGVAQEGQQEPTAEVVVQNRASTDAHVYVLQEGHMVALGFVESGANETLTIPPPLVRLGGPIRLIADALESAEWYKSDAVTVRPGSEVDFTIEGDFNRSTVSVRD